MQFPALVAFTMLISSAGVSAQQQTKRSVEHTCDETENHRLTDSYYKAVLSYIEPPAWDKSLIRITLGRERKLVLITDGEKYELDTDVPETSVYDFLTHLDESCRLPKDPKQAFSMIKVEWERSELSSAQFAQLHRDFTKALTEGVTQIQENYSAIIARKLYGVYVDAVRPSIVYEYSRLQIGIEIWDVQEDDKTDAIIEWVHTLQRLGEEKFHRQFRRK